MNYDKKEKGNKNNDKNQNNACKNPKFFVGFSDAIMDVDSCGCFEFRQNIFGKKVSNAISIPEKRYLLCDSDLKNAHKNWIFSKYDIMQIR